MSSLNEELQKAALNSIKTLNDSDIIKVLNYITTLGQEEVKESKYVKREQKTTPYVKKPYVKNESKSNYVEVKFPRVEFPTDLTYEYDFSSKKFTIKDKSDNVVESLEGTFNTVNGISKIYINNRYKIIVKKTTAQIIDSQDKIIYFANRINHPTSNDIITLVKQD